MSFVLICTCLSQEDRVVLACLFEETHAMLVQGLDHFLV